GTRFTETLAPDRIGVGDGGQVLLLLVVGAVENDGWADAVRTDAELCRRAVVGHLFVIDDLHHVGGSEAAVLGGPAKRKPPLGGELLLELPEELPAGFAAFAERAAADAVADAAAPTDAGGHLSAARSLCAQARSFPCAHRDRDG